MGGAGCCSLALALSWCRTGCEPDDMCLSCVQDLPGRTWQALRARYAKHTPEARAEALTRHVAPATWGPESDARLVAAVEAVRKEAGYEGLGPQSTVLFKRVAQVAVRVI